MLDWLSFFAGMSVDSIVVAALLVVLGPIIIERWMRENLFDTIEDFLADPRTNELVQNYVVKRIMGNLGGRPPSIAGAIKGGIAQLIYSKIAEAAGHIKIGPGAGSSSDIQPAVADGGKGFRPE